MHVIRSTGLRVLLFAAILSFLIALPTFAGKSLGGIDNVTRDGCVVTVTATVFESGTYYVNFSINGQITVVPVVAVAEVPFHVQFTITGPANLPFPYLGIVLSNGSVSLDGFAYFFPDDVGNSCAPHAAGCSIPIPKDASVGSLPADTQAYWAPGKISPNVVVKAGTYWVVAEEHDDAGDYFYKIILACQYLYVPVDAMGPSYQSPWNGQPLPSSVAYAEHLM